MNDRIPLYPGRVKMTPVAGQANTYDMVRADDPTQAGTPLNKASLLKDATAALYGKTNAAVPDDILSLLSKGVLAQTTGKYTKHTAINDLPVGSTLQLNVGGVARDFLVVQKGNPAPSIYDSSCDGVWLLMKEIYENHVWNSTRSNDYANSEICAYLNDAFLNLFDSSVQSAIKQVKIPYRAGDGTSKTVSSGADGLQTKIFLLSGNECDFTLTYMPTNEGKPLSYFVDATDEKRIAYLDGTAGPWWFRTPYCSATPIRVCHAGSSGGETESYSTTSRGMRPALILPPDYQYTFYTDDAGNIYTEQEYETALTDVLGTKLTVGVQIETGSYIGTGTYGQENPNTLTFGFAPKLVIISGRNYQDMGDSIIAITGNTFFMAIAGKSDSLSPDSCSFEAVSITGNSMSWYTTQGKVDYQFNSSGSVYHYIAIG